jgi:hypothetical protein
VCSALPDNQVSFFFVSKISSLQVATAAAARWTAQRENKFPFSPVQKKKKSPFSLPPFLERSFST